MDEAVEDRVRDCGIAPLLDVSADAYGSGRASYDLRRLRLRGLVERLPRSHRYRVTEAGQRVALCYCRGQRRVLALARSALFDDKAPPALGRLVARFDHHINRLDGRANDLLQELGSNGKINPTQGV